MKRRLLPLAGLRPGLIPRHVVLIGVAALALAGCKTNPEVNGPPYPVDYRQRHPIGIKEGEQKLELFIGGHRGALTPMQRAEVAAFASRWRRESSGGIIVEVPVQTSNARAAHDAAREARAILAAVGVPHGSVAVRPYRPPSPTILATVRLIHPKMVGVVGPCGLWPEDLGPGPERQHFENRPYWNLGCANQRNLAAMVENPADLVQPRSETPIYAGRRTTVLDKYRKGEGPATVYPASQQGKINTVGQ